jgi:probable F420-dependent oxidoreductase
VTSRAPAPLRFAVVSETAFTTAGRWLEHVRRIESAAVDTLLVRDHIVAEPFGPQLAPIAMLAAAAASTSRLRVGTLVLSNDYRHPALVAHEAATVDWLSGGRFELGLGAGWLRTDYDGIGLPFDGAGVRIDRLQEAIPIIAALLSGDTVSRRGTHYRVESLTLPTLPVQRPRPPLLIGAGGPRMLALAGQHADIVGILPAPIRSVDDPDDPADRTAAALTEKVDQVRRAAADRFDSIELSMFATFIVTSQRRRATEALIQQRGWTGVDPAGVWAMPSVFVGSVEQIEHDLQQRRTDFGISYFVTTDRALDTLESVLVHITRT